MGNKKVSQDKLQLIMEKIRKCENRNLCYIYTNRNVCDYLTCQTTFLIGCIPYVGLKVKKVFL